MKITKENLYLIKHNPSLLPKVPVIDSITDAIDRRKGEGHNCFFCTDPALVAYIVNFKELSFPFSDYGDRWLDLCPVCNDEVLRLNYETTQTI